MYKQLTIRVGGALYEKLASIAERTNVSLNSTIAAGLTQYAADSSKLYRQMLMENLLIELKEVHEMIANERNEGNNND